MGSHRACSREGSASRVLTVRVLPSATSSSQASVSPARGLFSKVRSQAAFTAVASTALPLENSTPSLSVTLQVRSSTRSTPSASQGSEVRSSPTLKRFSTMP